MHSPSQTTHLPAVNFLLAVWGESYIKNFCDFSLCSLLAAGNIPALSHEFECTFVFLTREEDISLFDRHPSFKRLLTYCRIEFINITDLVFEGNYTATLTLAYERGVRYRGEQMCETYFFFLVADYIVADGGLKNIGCRLKEGYNGITTGNFLVIEEHFSPLLLQKKKDFLIALEPQKLLEMAFPFLHPVSVSHTVTQNLTFAAHANRLFWKVNDYLMVGRFYLRHMLCIKPEITDYRIGSSCDYSFIPEMCPSGNVFHIRDSDEYCAIEMAPYSYEEKYIRRGAHTIDRLAQHFSEWTTAIHRVNAHIPVLFHSQKLSERPHKVIEESDAFIKAIEKKLSHPPQPIHGHFYWISCIDSLLFSLLQQKNRAHYYTESTFAGIVGSSTFAPSWWTESDDDRSLLKLTLHAHGQTKKEKRKIRLKKVFLGTFPQTSLRNIHYLDDRQLQRALQQKLAQKASCLVIAFEPIAPHIEWLEKNYPGQCTYLFFDFLLRRSPSELQPLFKEKQEVLIWLPEDYFCELGAALRTCSHYLPPGSSLMVSLKYKTRVFYSHFQKRAAICSADLLASHLLCESIHTTYSLCRNLFEKRSLTYSEKAFAPGKKLIQRLLGFFGLFLLNILSLPTNLLNSLHPSSRKHLTSALLHFKTQKAGE